MYGGIDGAITTFAVVSGAAGANADLFYVLLFGFANLVADGLSMSVGNYFSVKTERENFDKHKNVEHWEIEHMREREVDEIREIYAAKGFKGELLEQVVEVITSDEDVWVDTMMKEELEMMKDHKSPFKTAFATFLSFNIVGIIPLLSYVFAIFMDIDHNRLFIISCVSTALAMGVIGYLKGKVTERPALRSIAETVLLGGLAAIFAYAVGDLLANWFLN